MKAQVASLVSDLDPRHERLMACLGKTKPTDLEASPQEMQSKVEHKEVPKEHASVETCIVLNKQHRGRNLAAECRHKLKDESQRKLATGHRGMTLRAKVAWCKIHQGQGKNKVLLRTSKRQMFRRKCQSKPEHKNGIGNQGQRQQLQSKREFNKTLRKTLGWEFVKRGARMSSGLREIRN
jgi:hypothetical protein